MLPEAMPAMMHLGEAERRRGSHIYLVPRHLPLKQELPSPNPQVNVKAGGQS